jgi:ribose transport system substrate-binding protein
VGKENWHSKLDEIILLELARAGNYPPMRLTGILVGLGSFLPAAKNCRIKHLDGDGELGLGFEAVGKHLRSTRARRQVVGATNDASALGALRAFQEAGRSECCAIMGHNASPEGRAELRQPTLVSSGRSLFSRSDTVRI